MKKSWIAAGIALLCSVTGIISYFYWDIPLAQYCRSLSQPMIDIAQIVTIMGESKWYYILLVPAFIVFRFIVKKKLWAMKVFFLFISISVSGLVNLLFKWLAGRHRPVDLFNRGLSGFDNFGITYETTSFPSGHAVTAFTLAAALSILFPRWGILAFIIAAAIAISRVTLTSHYLSDALVGAGTGILYAMAVKYIFDRYNIELIRKS